MIELVSLVALMLLCMVGYSGGLVLGRLGRAPEPSLMDLAAQLVVWAGAFLVRGALGKWWALALGLAVGAVAGATVALLARGRGDLRLEGEHGFFRALGNVQARIVMGFLYFTLLAPFALISRLAGDPLALREPEEGASLWFPRRSPPESEEEARRQW